MPLTADYPRLRKRKLNVTVKSTVCCPEAEDLERWKERSGDSATYRNLVGIFERVEDQTLVNYVYRLLRTTKRLSHTIEDRN